MKLVGDAVNRLVDQGVVQGLGVDLEALGALHLHHAVGLVRTEKDHVI